MARKWKKTDPKCPRCGSHHLTVDASGEGDTWQARCKDCHKKWPFDSTVFQNETMTCAMCGKTQRHVVGLKTDWRYIELDGRGNYVCTDHFPPDGSPTSMFRNAYVRIITHLSHLIQKKTSEGD